MRASGHWFWLGPAVVMAAMTTAKASSMAFDSPLAPREIKACVLTSAGAANALIFHALSLATVRPQDWTFVNPLAPEDGTPAVGGGWGAVPRSSPAYWTVTQSDAQRLIGMDVIYMPVGGAVNIPQGPDEDGLLRAVENGALLWIDQTGGTVPGITRLQPPRTTPIQAAAPGSPPDPVPFVFEPTGAPVGFRVPADSRSEFFNIPFALQEWEVGQVGSGDFRIRWPYTDSSGWLHQTDVDFQPVIRLLDSGGNDIGVAAMVTPYGTGAILVTAGDVGRDIVSWLGQAGPGRKQLSDVRFAFNALAWFFQMRQQPSGGGRAAASVVDAPIDLRWQYPAANRAGVHFGPVVGAPLYYNGRVFVAACQGAAGAARLVCLDPQPEQDIDGDGNRDDGVVDFSTGVEYDVIWELVFGGGQTPKTSGVVGAVVNGVPVVLCSTSSINPGNGDVGHIWCLQANTGAPVWAMGPSFTIPPYDASAAVCDVSTPVVHNGWVYFTVSEVDSRLPGSGVEDTYGRVWCIDLRTGGDLATVSTDGGAQWVFPDPDLDRAGPGNIAEPQRSLPCFNDPEWVAGVGGRTELPPVATGTPVITAGVTTASGRLIDAAMLVGTPVSHRWDGTRIVTDNWTSWDSRSGGSAYCLVPGPMGGNGTNPLDLRLNKEYYAVALSEPATGWNGARRRGDPGGTNPPLALPYDTDFPAAVAHFQPVNATDSGVRQFLAQWAAAGNDPLAVQRGWEIELSYDPPAVWETYFLPGPVLWQTQFGPNEQQVGGGVARRNHVFFPTIAPVDYPWSYPPRTPTAPNPIPTGLISALDTESGSIRWRIDPRSALPISNPPSDIGSWNGQSLLLAAPAEDGGVLAAAVSQWPIGGGGAAPRVARHALLGLKDTANLQIRLGYDLPPTVQVSDAPGAVEMQLLECLGTPDPVVPPSSYQVDPLTRVLRVPPEVAHDVGVAGTAGSDPITGKAVLVTWDDTDGTTHGPELHLFKPAHVFAYVPGFIKLSKYPVDYETVRVLLADETPDLSDNPPILGVAPGEPLVNWGGRNLLANGWLDLRQAFLDLDGNGSYDAATDRLAVGLDVVVTYTGFYEQAIGWTPPATWPPAVRAAYTPDANGFTPIPNPGLSLRAERHQVPVVFGQPMSAPVFAGTTLLLGTEGFDGNDWAGGFEVPGGATPDPIIGPTETLLALNWDPVSGELWGRMARPAETPAGEVPAVSAPVTVAGDLVLVGSRGMIGPGQTNGLGYLSALSTERTVIAAGSRIVECVGGRVVRTIVGTRDLAGGNVRPFGHIAKVTRLPGGTLLVVDSGNNQVLEITMDGRVVWPLGAGTGNAKMLLNRPTDAWRYYTWHGPGLRWAHTVIADAGHNRIVEIVSKPTAPGEPPDTHEVYVVSPPSVLATDIDPGGRPGQFLEFEYQKAQPILDPVTGDLWGYLACASNWPAPLIVVPPRWDPGSATVIPARLNPLPSEPVIGARIGAPLEVPSISPGATWAPWAPVYNLRFENIRHVEYTVKGAVPFAVAEGYVWIVASADRVPAPYRGLYPAPADMGVYEFSLGAGGVSMTYRFTRDDYLDPAVTNLGIVPLPTGGKFNKPFFPTAARRLPNGDYLIVNYVGATDHLALRNLGLEAFGSSLDSEVFRVTVNRTVSPPLHAVFGRNVIPDPARVRWPEPLSLVSFAERY